MTRTDFKEIIRGNGGVELNINLKNMQEGEKFLKAMNFNEAFTAEKKEGDF